MNIITGALAAGTADGWAVTCSSRYIHSSQFAPRRTRPPSLCLCHVCPSLSPSLRSAEGFNHFSTRAPIEFGSSTGTGTQFGPVPVVGLSAPPCNAAASREPSRRLCTFFRKSKGFTISKTIWRYNASGGPIGIAQLYAHNSYIGQTACLTCTVQARHAHRYTECAAS